MSTRPVLRHHVLDLYAQARRHARRPDEVEDIVQEVLAAAFAAGRMDFTLPENRRWSMGAVRRRAAFDARGARRRRLRETQWAMSEPDGAETVAHGREAVAAVLTGLPPSLRVVAALALSGHGRRDIAYLLDLPDTALRQRIRALKRAVSQRGAVGVEMAGLFLDLNYGVIRQDARLLLARHGGLFASHDPDGHIFLVQRGL